MPEYFSDESIRNVVLVNKHISERRRESFGINTERLSKVFSKVNDFNEISDKKQRITKKAANLLGGMTFHQPFNNGNKRTALSVTLYFLRKNGFDIDLGTLTQEKEMFELLEKTMLKIEGDETIISEVEDYLTRKLIDRRV
jgi:prophage maintenance system killer protein